MAKILITGMTASQASPAASERSASYASIIRDILESRGHEVDWRGLPVGADATDFGGYDCILVGLAPVTSLAANRAYGALSAVERLFGDDRLRFFIDAPRPELIVQSLRSVDANPDSLFKEFYSYREGYSEAKTEPNAKNIRKGVRLLLNDQWPRTIYPNLPWYGTEMSKIMPTNAVDAIHGLNLDSTLIETSFSTHTFTRDPVWVTETAKSPWLDRTLMNLSSAVAPMKSHKHSSDKDVQIRISTALGALMPPQRDGSTWWSFRYLQAMHSGTPIATEWRHSKMLGDSWAALPSQIESMSPETRTMLAAEQANAYVKELPHPQQTIANLELTLGTWE